MRRDLFQIYWITDRLQWTVDAWVKRSIKIQMVTVFRRHYSCKVCDRITPLDNPHMEDFPEDNCQWNNFLPTISLDNSHLNNCNPWQSPLRQSLPAANLGLSWVGIIWGILSWGIVQLEIGGGGVVSWNCKVRMSFLPQSIFWMQLLNSCKLEWNRLFYQNVFLQN